MDDLEIKVADTIHFVTNTEIKLRQKSGFAVSNIMAAIRFSKICDKIETEHKRKELGPFFDEGLWGQA